MRARVEATVLVLVVLLLAVVFYAGAVSVIEWVIS